MSRAMTEEKEPAMHSVEVKDFSQGNGKCKVPEVGKNLHVQGIEGHETDPDI